MNKLRLVRHFAAALSATAVASTQAAVIHWSDANLVIPATYEGLYINIEERTTGSGEDLAGWDMNPYGANGLLWYQPVGGGVLRIEDTAGPSNLALGALVGAGGLFDEESVTEFGAQPYNWNFDASNYFGFSFEASDGLLHYGWGRMDIGAASTNRVLAELAYEDVAGASIAVGAVPAPGALALIGLAGLLGRRRR
ncbi:MAG: hypothetical protein DWH97_12600 [Planctomycetota bacterium]|jgi:MYXO-CTERM domain-containing protein|nr:MAG: hypothetical protein DWH97_12600 [Planctomycetota bacterium]